MISLLVSILIALLVFGALWYVLGLLAGVFPPPFVQIARVILGVIFAIWILLLVLRLAGVVDSPFLLPYRGIAP